MKHVLAILLLSTVLLTASARPHHQDSNEDIRRGLAKIENRIVDYINVWHPEANQKEQEEMLRMLVHRMKKHIRHNLRKQDRQKHELFARMLR